jgi:hypothetical protein
LRNPEKRENFLQTLSNLRTAISSQNLTKLKIAQDYSEKMDQVHQSDENLENLQRIKHSLEDMQASLNYTQREFSSTISVVKILANLLQQ